MGVVCSERLYVQTVNRNYGVTGVESKTGLLLQNEVWTLSGVEL